MIGRKKETAELRNLLESNKPELIAVYGRRRVGKTYLIDETYRNYIVFRHTGLPPIYDKRSKDNDRDNKLKRQLDAFVQSLAFYNLFTAGDDAPKTWLEAFGLLSKKIDEKYPDKRIVLFIDELPWMDTPRSYFLEAFTYFWNNYCCFHRNIVLVVCGSSSSWILDNVIHNHGGLYGRITYSLKLMPFDLGETEEYLKSIGVDYSRYDIANAFMSVGGIPYYLNYFRRGLSLAQNLDQMFFNKGALLEDEFDELFSSQFTNYQKYKKVVEVLNSKKAGYTAAELASLTGSSLNSVFYNILKALEKGGFIQMNNPFGSPGNERVYRLIDPFCLFYLNNVKTNAGKDKYWETNIDSQAVVVWRGLAFENICFHHIDKIKEKLGIKWMATEECMWIGKGDDKKRGAQIDMLIQRKDNVVNLCEAKFYASEVTVDKAMHLDLMNKVERLRPLVSKKASIINVLITTYGLKSNEYSYDYPVVVTLDDLFRES